jgi:hypothetical protein
VRSHLIRSAREIAPQLPVLFRYHGAAGIAGSHIFAPPLVESFARASAAKYRFTDPYGVLGSVGSGEIRRHHAVDGVSPPWTTLIEPAATNLVANCQDVSNASWVKSGVTVTGSQADPFNGTTAQLLTADSAVSAVDAAVSFASSGTKALLVLLKQGSGAKSKVALYDSTAAVTRHEAEITWGGTPTVATTTGSGTLYPVLSLSEGFWLFALTAAGVVHTNSNRIVIAPSSAAAGTCYFAGVQVDDRDFPTSFTGNTARAREDLYYGLGWTGTFPVPLCVYLRFVEQFYPANWPGGYIFGIGDTTSGQSSNLEIYRAAAGAGYAARYSGYAAGVLDGTSVTTGIGNAAAPGDVVELLVSLSTAIQTTIACSINGAAETASAPAGAVTSKDLLAGQPSRIYLGERKPSADTTMPLALLDCKVIGAAVTMAQARAA